MKMVSRVFVAVLALGFLASCGGNDDITPVPVAASTSTPAPATTATPLPSGACVLNLPKGPGPGVNCPRTSATMMKLMEDAVNHVRNQNPSAYPLDGVGFICTADQLDDFFKKVVDHINAGGQACAYRDGLELALKSSNRSSEQYKFWITSGHLRLGDSAYRATCTPAWF